MPLHSFYTKLTSHSQHRLWTKDVLPHNIRRGTLFPCVFLDKHTLVLNSSHISHQRNLCNTLYMLFLSVSSFSSLLQFTTCKDTLFPNTKQVFLHFSFPFKHFPSNSDIDWSRSIGEIDAQLYEKYGLEKDEIEFIERMIKPME